MKYKDVTHSLVTNCCKKFTIVLTFSLLFFFSIYSFLVVKLPDQRKYFQYKMKQVISHFNIQSKELNFQNVKIIKWYTFYRLTMSLKFDLQNTLPFYLVKQRFSKNQKPLQEIWRTLKASLNPLELFSRYGAIPLLNTRILPGLEISRQTAKC